MSRRLHGTRKTDRRSTEDVVTDLLTELGSACKASVLQKISDLQKLTGPVWGNRTANHEYISDTRKDIDRLQRRLEKLPGHVRYRLFMPDFGLPSDKQAETTKPGAHASSNHLQRKCAVEAKVLMEDRGLPVVDGRLTSKFGRIASLLYEAVTGACQDLEWACRAVVNVPIVREIGK
jgi:hypothetical protein